MGEVKMIKEAIQYLVGMGKAEIHEENGQAYSDKKLQLLEEPTAEPFVVHNLSGLVGYLKSEFDGNEKVIVHVIDPETVEVSSVINGNKRRDCFVKAEAMLPDMEFDHWYNSEDLNIKLQSCFVKNEDRGVMLKVVGNIVESNVKTIKDDGATQAVTIKQGAEHGMAQVPNPVVLAPFRTFVEVEQPETEFIFRMKDGPRCALFEADGGAWKIEAMSGVKAYLEKRLEKEVTSERITIIA